MLFDTSNEWLESLDPDMRQKLIDLMEARAEYFQAASNVALMRAEQFKGSSLFYRESYEEYIKEHLEPNRQRMMKIMHEMLGEAVDPQKIISMFPMILAGVMSQVDVELLLNILNIDVDHANEMKKFIQDFIK